MPAGPSWVFGRQGVDGWEQVFYLGTKIRRPVPCTLPNIDTHAGMQSASPFLSPLRYNGKRIYSGSEGK
jgi:hypothetical protein